MELINYKKQYGKFKFKPYLFQFIGILLSSILALWISIDQFRHLWMSILIWIYDIGWLVIIIAPYLKWYYLDFPNVHVKIICRNHTVKIPENYSVVISPMEFRPPFCIQGQCTGDYCVSVVEADDLSWITERLHRNYAKRYTNVSIQDDFGPLFVTEFVYDDSIPSELFQNAAHVIVPGTIKDCLKLSAPNVMLDSGY